MIRAAGPLIGMSLLARLGHTGNFMPDLAESPVSFRMTPACPAVTPDLPGAGCLDRGCATVLAAMISGPLTVPAQGSPLVLGQARPVGGKAQDWRSGQRLIPCGCLPGPEGDAGSATAAAEARPGFFR